MADQPKKKSPSAVSRNDNRANGKRTKTKPTDTFKRNSAYRGSHTRKTPQSALQKVLNGGGLLRNTGRRVDGTNPAAWKMPTTVHEPYDRAQVEENKRLYPHLFADR